VYLDPDREDSPFVAQLRTDSAATN
jgi:hypothetical protein